MLSQFAHLIALIATFGILSGAQGASVSLLLQQGAHYQFSDVFLGLLISISYVGFFIGSYLVRYLLPRISYIRTFAVCVSALAVLTLLLPILPSEISWGISRLLHGLFFSAALVICDSWLNANTSDEMRSRMNGAYMTSAYVAYGLSQGILIVGENLMVLSFSVVAILFIFSMLPLCLTRSPEPQFSVTKEEGSKLSLLDAYRIAPIAGVGQFVVGLANGAGWLFVRYAEGVSDDANTVALLATLFYISGFILQMPFGWLSDKAKDRRNVMAVNYGLAAALSGVLFFGDVFPTPILVLCVLLYGAVSVTPFSLNVSYGQDFAGRARSAEYAGRLFQFYASGALLGPVICGYLMDAFSLSWLFGFLFLVFFAITAITITNLIMPRYIPIKQESHKVLSPHVPPSEAPEYTELEVGPVLPEDDAEGDADVIGPTQPEELTVEDDDTPSDADFVGPTAEEKTN